MHFQGVFLCILYTPSKMRYNARHWKFFPGYISVYPKSKTFNLGKFRPFVELFCDLLQSVPQTKPNSTKTPAFGSQKLPKHGGFVQCYTIKTIEKYRFRPISAVFGVIRWFWAIPQILRLNARGWISLFRGLLPAPARLAPFPCVLWRSVAVSGAFPCPPVYP